MLSSEDKSVFAEQKCVITTQTAVLFSMIFGRTELIISVSEAKFDEEADGEVHLSLNPLKPNQNYKKLFFLDRMFSPIFFFRRRKIKRRESSETRFPKFSRRSEPSSRGKRPFEISKKI